MLLLHLLYAIKIGLVLLLLSTSLFRYLPTVAFYCLRFCLLCKAALAYNNLSEWIFISLSFSFSLSFTFVFFCFVVLAFFSIFPFHLEHTSIHMLSKLVLTHSSVNPFSMSIFGPFFSVTFIYLILMLKDKNISNFFE